MPKMRLVVAAQNRWQALLEARSWLRNCRLEATAQSPVHPEMKKASREQTKLFEVTAVVNDNSGLVGVEPDAQEYLLTHFASQAQRVTISNGLVTLSGEVEGAEDAWVVRSGDNMWIIRPSHLSALKIILKPHGEVHIYSRQVL